MGGRDGRFLVLLITSDGALGDSGKGGEGAVCIFIFLHEGHEVMRLNMGMGI